LGPVTWKRLPDIASLRDSNGDMNIFFEEIEPNDIQQGELGDCYFLSSLAAIAEEPERIRSMFLNLEANEAGVYGAFMCKNG
jgi:calpain-15